MTYNPNKHHRRSIRLKEYNYNRRGAYFVTICVNQRECLLGEIIDNQILLNDIGMMVQQVWLELSEKYPGVGLDEFVIMPNHIHGIILLEDTNQKSWQSEGQPQDMGQPQGVAPTGLSLPDVVHRFKSYTTTKYRHGVRDFGWKPFQGRLWQRNYYEHIIRNDQSLNAIRSYIEKNPRMWDLDNDNPNQKMLLNKMQAQQFGLTNEEIKFIYDIEFKFNKNKKFAGQT